MLAFIRAMVTLRVCVGNSRWARWMPGSGSRISGGYGGRVLGIMDSLQLDLPRNRGQGVASRRSPFKGLGTDAAQVIVATGSIVERVEVVEDVGTG